MRATIVLGLISAACAAALSPPDQFLVDKSTALVAIVEIDAVETRWTVIEHGDHIPVLRVTSHLVRTIVGSGLEPGAVVTSLHFDYTDMLMAPISPPPVIDRRYLLFANTVEPESTEWIERIDVGHLAHPQGSYLLCGEGDERFIHWEGKRYLLRDIEELLTTAGPLPLAEIEDPEARLRIAAQRLEDGAIDGPADFTTALLELIHEAASFEDWYESLALLRRAARRPELSAVVVAGLRPRVLDADPQKSRAIAAVLAELDDATGLEVLQKALEDGDVALNADPDGNLTLPNRVPYDSSSVAAAAWALGRLGDHRGLGHTELDVRLAAASGLADRGTEDARQALLPIAAELDQRLEALRREGRLTAPREQGDFRQRYPHHWVRVHQLLARLGDDRSLRKLLEANRIDWATYPETERAAFPRMQVGQWSNAPFGWPDLRGALAGADPDPDRLLARLNAISQEDDEVLVALRASLQDKPVEEPETDLPDEETLHLIAEQLAADDPEIRARGLAGAGYNRVDEHFQRVLATALDRTGIEKQAALYGLGFYEREISVQVLHRLSREGSLAQRFGGVELATRNHPEPFAEDTIALLRELMVADDPDDFELRNLQRFGPRIVSRFSRGDIPPPIVAGLRDENPAVAAAVATGLGMGGNPDAVGALMEVAATRKDDVKSAAEWALEALEADCALEDPERR